MEVETVYTEECDGWTISVGTAPDYDYVPGRDDDVFPEIQYGELPAIDCPRCDGDGCLETPTGGVYDCPKCEGTGEVDDDAGVSGYDDMREPWHVTGEALRELAEINGATVEVLGEDATKIARGELTHVGVIVTARRGKIRGEASLWGVGVDLSRPQESEGYVREVGDELRDEAIEAAARSAVGNLAPLALSY
jgi:hypothetical protein